MKSFGFPSHRQGHSNPVKSNVWPKADLSNTQFIMNKQLLLQITEQAARPAAESRARSAFTFLELLVVLLVLALLVPVVALSLVRSNPVAKSLQCLYNTRQLVVGWQMYAQENHDKMLPVLQGGAAQGGAGDPTLGAGWVEGWLDWTLSTDNTNTAFLTNPRYARIAPYLRGSTNLFQCPADTYLIGLQQSRWSRRSRSYSASVGIGVGNAQTGPWDSLYHQITKISDFQFPGPAQTFVYLDEHPDSINDPGLFSPHQATLVDVPATYHNDGASFSFADGHAEIHKWTACLTQPRARQVLGNTSFSIVSSAGDPDIHWLSFHTQRVSTNSY